MRIWNSRLLDSKIKTDTVSKAEMILGYLIGPSLMYLMTTALSGTYLMQFYTDVIGISGTMIVLMPVISKIGVVIMNIIFSSLINKTNTRQGKARPWLLISGIILPLAGILLYAVPQASYRIQVIWILLSYNFFFVVAYNIYILSHSMMLPRSTRDSASRDKLTLFKTVSESMIPGTLSAVIMPFIIRAIGVGNGAQEKWFRFMLILSIIAVPAALIEYYFTIERTEDTNRENITLLQQLKESFRYRKWVMIIILISLKALESAFLSNTMIYYCNWVIGNSIDSGAHYQALLNVIGQGPLGIGAFLMASLLKRSGYDVRLAGDGSKQIRLLFCSDAATIQSYKSYDVDGRRYFLYGSQDNEFRVKDVMAQLGRPVSMKMQREQRMKDFEADIPEFSYNDGTNREKMLMALPLDATMVKNMKARVDGQPQQYAVQQLMSRAQSDYQGSLRTLMFYRMVRDVTGLQVVSENWQGRNVVGVCITDNDNVEGEYVVRDGMHYVLCDPDMDAVGKMK